MEIGYKGQSIIIRCVREIKLKTIFEYVKNSFTSIYPNQQVDKRISYRFHTICKRIPNHSRGMNEGLNSDAYHNLLFIISNK